MLALVLQRCFILLGFYVTRLDAEDSPQVLSDHVGPCMTATYLKYVRALKCNQAYGQQLVDLYLNCGYNEMALMESIDCGVRKGEFCFDIAGRAQEYQAAVDSLCFNTYGKPSCSNSCQEALWNFRKNVGCCVNNLYNTSAEPIFNDRTASNLLWTLCGVTPIRGFCKSTLDYKEVYDSMVCVYDEVMHRKSLLDCSPSYGQAFVDLFRTCDYLPQMRHAVNICGINGEGRYCFDLIEDGDSLAEDVREHCVEAMNSECPLACQVALDTYRRRLGCCLNNLYNNKDSSYFSTTSPALWKTCGIKRPRSFCKTTLSMTGGSSVLSFSSAAIIIGEFFLCMLVY